MKIVILGAGELGTVIGGLIQKKQPDVTFWDSDPVKRQDGTLESLIPLADFVFFCVPSWTLREAITTVLPFLKPTCSLTFFSKGIEEQSLKTVPELVLEIAPSFSTAVVGGPMLAGEMKVGKPSVIVLASKDEALRSVLVPLFSSSESRVEVSDDPYGVSLTGVLKNIYAVSLGIADGLELSGNQKGWLVSQAIEEMVQIGKILGVDQNVILGTTGVGDLIATGFSSYSRNRTVGHEIVKTGVCNFRGEGLSSLPSLMERLGEKSSQFRLLNFINYVGIQCQPAAPAFQKFFDEKK